MFTPAVKFGDLIRVRADSAPAARNFAETWTEMKREENHARMMTIVQYDDMAGDCFILTGLHWRESMSPLGEHTGGSGADYIRWIQSEEGKPGGEEQRDIAERIWEKEREIILRELKTPDVFQTLDLRLNPDDSDTDMPQAFAFHGTEGNKGRADAKNEAECIKNYLRCEFGTEEKDIAVVTPNDTASSTYVFLGDMKEWYDDLRVRHFEPGFEKIMDILLGGFIEGLRDAGLLHEVDVREQTS